MTAHLSRAERAELRRHAAQSAAILAENWTDRKGKGRPTVERRRRGQFALIDGDNAVEAIAVDGAATMLDRLRIARLIADRQAQAGHDLAALLDRTAIIAGLRSCLDFEPHGYGSDHEPGHGELRDLSKRRALIRLVGAAWPLTRAVVVEHRVPTGPGNLGHLRAALDRCARFWRL